VSCELCNQPGGTLVWQDADCRVVLVDDADYPGFCRVIWQHHVREMTDLSSGERAHLMEIVFGVETSVRLVMQPHKINLASLGNMTPHVHWHIIPRYASDKHFPQPIWGAAQRAGAGQVAPGWRITLADTIRARLEALPC
jgi:diadenosine tetraphosphate (Ap4A) HIT family hydrolase